MLMSLAVDMALLQRDGERQTNFSTKLLVLIPKADLHNRELIRKGFPNAVKTVEYYLKTGEILDLEYD